jgi:hypothetical protein
MTSDTKKEPSTLLCDALVNDLLKLDEAELMDELAQEGGDLEHEARAARTVLAKALMVVAQSSLRPPNRPNDRATQSRNGIRDGAAIRIAKYFHSNDDSAPGEFTLAARNGRGLSERELQEIVNDLRELGAFEGGVD